MCFACNKIPSKYICRCVVFVVLRKVRNFENKFKISKKNHNSNFCSKKQCKSSKIAEFNKGSRKFYKKYFVRLFGPKIRIMIFSGELHFFLEISRFLSDTFEPNDLTILRMCQKIKRKIHKKTENFQKKDYKNLSKLSSSTLMSKNLYQF